MRKLSVGEIIRSRRRLSGRSLKSLAVKAGLSKSALSRIELGEQEARASELQAIATALGVLPADLFPEGLEEKADASTPPTEAAS